MGMLKACVLFLRAMLIPKVQQPRFLVSFDPLQHSFVTDGPCWIPAHRLALFPRMMFY